jgi:nucleotide sugar dehydrogenase
MIAKNSNILIVGGGFVGLTLAAKLLKNESARIVILEQSQTKVYDFKNQNYRIYEPGLDQIFSDSVKQGRLRFEQILENDLFDIIFICINTQKNDSNMSENQQKLFDKLSFYLDFGGHIYLRSTVQVGITSQLYEYIQSSTRKDVKVFFAPERTAEGVALQELDFLPQLLGSPNNEDLIAGSRVLTRLGFTVIQTSNSESAEFIKLICNVWRDSIFAISNELAVFAEKLDLNIFEIIEKANFDYPRANIPKPGPVGGPCLSKDTYILMESLPPKESINSLILAARRQNENLENIALQKILEHKKINKGKPKIVFLGAAFKGKPKTNDFRESFTKNLVQKIEDASVKCEIKIWDPSLKPEDLLEFSKFYMSDLHLDSYDIVVFGNSAEFLFTEKVSSFLNEIDTRSLIIDMWGVLENSVGIKGNLYRFGRKVVLNEN